jgi:hypothetical protein
VRHASGTETSVLRGAVGVPCISREWVAKASCPRTALLLCDRSLLEFDQEPISLDVYPLVRDQRRGHRELRVGVSHPAKGDLV